MQNLVKREITEMDGLRGLAILSVLILHTLPHYFPGWKFLYSVAGQLAVPLFFAVSGFCISYGIIYRNFKGKSVFVKDFASRRFWRIYPPYIVAVIIFFIKVYFIEASSGTPLTSGEIGRMIFYNVTLSQVIMGDTLEINPAFWSLCVELQFYILVAVILAVSQFLTRNALVWIVCLLLVAGLGINIGVQAHLLAVDPVVWFMALPNYLPLFALGSLLAWMHLKFLKNGKLSFLDDTVMVCAAGITIILVNWGWIIALLLISAALHDRWILLRKITAFSDWKWLRYLGERSYSIYLIHGLGIAFMSKFGGRYVEKNLILSLGILVLSWVVALIMGFIFYHFIERHFIRSVANSTSVTLVPARG